MSLVQPSEKVTLQTGEIFASSKSTLHHKNTTNSFERRYDRRRGAAIKQSKKRCGNRTIEEEELPWETLEVRLSNRIARGAFRRPRHLFPISIGFPLGNKWQGGVSAATPFASRYHRISIGKQMARRRFGNHAICLPLP
jgi:hypothetical protein